MGHDDLAERFSSFGWHVICVCGNDLDELLQAFCGGGHAAAAGVRKRTNDVEKFRQEILERIITMKKIFGQDK